MNTVPMECPPESGVIKACVSVCRKILRLIWGFEEICDDQGYYSILFSDIACNRVRG
jgi:hypothetical protein